MPTPVLAATGVFTPPHVITNDELVASYNAHAALWNEEHGQEIAAGTLRPKAPSSSGFIVGASGIERRHVVEKEGVLDPPGCARACPRAPPRSPRSWPRWRSRPGARRSPRRGSRPPTSTS